MNYSQAALGLPGSGIRRMFTLAAQMSDVCNLSVGQPDFPTPPHIIDAYVAALREGQTRYTLDQGHPALLEALAETYTARYGLPVSPDNVLVTCGGCEAVYVALRTILNPGDEVLLFEPAFVLFKPIVELCGAVPVILPTRAEDGFLPDLEQIREALTARTTCVVVNSPSNPTGAVWPAELLAALVQLVRQRGLWLLADEVYERIVFDTPYVHAARLAGGLANVLAVGSFSKTYSMAGMRIGYLLADAATLQMARKVHMYTSNVANTAGQLAAVAALRGPQEPVEAMVAAYRARRDRLVELVATTPQLTCYTPQGAFYLSPALPPQVDAGELCLQMLQETGVCCVPGGTFGETCRHTFRIAYSVAPATIDEAFRRIRRWLAQRSF
ncbi:MAG: aminotransferase class I/II-fold pyridoxal phosphate-dependent enzyme [Fimbriimonadaceae bacterium]|nr:aminotransferase class I/II-fold pyridoxal phosphate-dependent enzyme [Fimbriimonadaceae bacterium]